MNARAFIQLVVTQATMLRRNVSYWVISVFIAVISMAVFGWLFSPNAQPFDLALADRDGSESSRALVRAFAGLENVDTSQDPLEEEMERFEDGELGAVVMIPEGFGKRLAGGQATVQVLLDNSDPIRAAYARTTVDAVVNSYNQEVVGVTNAVTVERQAQDTGSGRFIDFLTPGMVGMTVMWTNLMVGFLLVTWRELGILRRLGVTPLRPGILIGSQAVSFALISLVQVAVILLMGRFIFDVEINGSYLWLAVTVLMGVLSMLSLGYVIASFLRTANSVSATANLVAFPMMFLGRSYFPMDAPPALAPLVYAIPLTHLNDALREVVNHGNGPGELWVSWAALAAWIVGGFVVSMRLFRWQ